MIFQFFQMIIWGFDTLNFECQISIFGQFLSMFRQVSAQTK